jgi:hypothetical protein
MVLSESASALGLYKYNCEQPERGIFGRFYATILNQLHAWGVTPTYVGAEGNGYSGKFTKIGGRMHDKLVRSDFADVTVLSLAANPPGSEEPSYDNYVSCSLSYVAVNLELLACIVVNESFVKLRSSKYEALLRSQLDLCPWDFGYGFSSSVQKQPDFHILGLDNGKLSTEEYKSLSTWYEAPGDVRAALLRDVYPYNLLNDRQLDAQVSNGVTLRRFAECQPGCSMTPLTEHGLYLWQVPDAEVARLRRLLAGSPALV